MNKEIFSFVIYIIHACANKWNVLPSEVYDAMDKTKCISDFLVRHYDIIHTQGTDYIVEDVSDYLKERGISV